MGGKVPRPVSVGELSGVRVSVSVGEHTPGLRFGSMRVHGQCFVMGFEIKVEVDTRGKQARSAHGKAQCSRQFEVVELWPESSAQGNVEWGVLWGW